VYQGPLGGVVYFDDAELLLEGSSGTGSLGMGLGAGDFDGDGLVDLVAPAPGVSGRGRAYLVLGGTL
jgi:hypothetical protein